jgi:hypothetical protein
MKSFMRSLALVLPLTLSLAGCSDAFDFGTFDLDFDERVEIAAAFENGSGLATIGNLRVSWDGETLQDLVPSTPVAQVSVSATRYGRQRGSHRLSFQILGQTSSPNTYRVTRLTITSYNEQGAVSRTLELEPRTALLETNAVITYDFRID